MELLMEYLSTLSTLGLLNAVICLGICIRLMFYQRNGAKYSPFYSVVAYTLTVSSGAVCISILSKQYISVDVWEVIINAALLIAICAAKGNVARVMKRQYTGRSSDDLANH
jgi:hypothetical protein